LFSLRIAVPATVFRFTVVLFALFGLAIFSLCFALVFALSRTAAFVTTIGLSSKTASADTKMEIAPSTLKENQ
jgi:ABC-type transport system involved in cytochrome bd biosynthesis fused ATPase/permease subunit